MLGALFRLIFSNVLGNVWILVVNLLRLPRLLGRPRWVRIDVKEPLPARPVHERLFRKRPSLAGLALACERLGKDPRLVGVVLRLSHVSGGWAKMQTLRGMIEKLRRAGKRVIVHLSAPSLREYYMACAADQILVDETGPLSLLGLAAETTFFGGALAKAGARAEAEYRGEYKSFAETFTREEMSPAHREALDAILDELYAQVRDAVAASRKVDAERAAAICTGGPYTAEEAAERKIVDGVRYVDEIAGWIGDPAPRLASLAEWQARRLVAPRWKPLLGLGRRVRVVSLHGGIVGGEGTEFPRRTIGGEAAARALDAARKDRRVAAVVLHVDSRGGSAPASDRIWRETSRLAEKKPVVAYFDDVAASGGYYLACAATKIVAQPGTLTGSIGVVAGKLNLAGLYEKLGLRSVVLTRGDAAAMHHVSRGLTSDERGRLAAEVDALYRQFVRKVAAGRKLAVEAAEAAAKGRVWIGAHARERGLVDELGDVDRAIELARELSRRRAGEKLPVEDVVVAPRRRNLLARVLLSRMEAEVPAPLAEIVELFAMARERVLMLADVIPRWD